MNHSNQTIAEWQELSPEAQDAYRNKLLPYIASKTSWLAQHVATPEIYPWLVQLNLKISNQPAKKHLPEKLSKGLDPAIPFHLLTDEAYRFFKSHLPEYILWMIENDADAFKYFIQMLLSVNVELVELIEGKRN